LRLQARSMAKFLPPDWWGRIFIILNDTRLPLLRKVVQSEIMPEFGWLRSRVSLIAYYRLIGTLDPFNGWIAQQAIKILASNIVDTEYYLALDAKNHFVRPVAMGDFFSAAGKARQEITQTFIWTLLKDHYASSCAAVGVRPAKGASHFLPTTPFLFHTETVRELVTEIEHHHGRSFDRFFCGTRNLSEFLLYEAFLHSRRGLMERLYEDKPKSTVFFAKSPEVDRDFEKMLIHAKWCPDVIAVACHREYLRSVDSDHLRMLTEFWREIGLLSAGEELSDPAFLGSKALAQCG